MTVFTVGRTGDMRRGGGGKSIFSSTHTPCVNLYPGLHQLRTHSFSALSVDIPNSS